MNDNCETCDIEKDCGYEDKPTECCNRRKFKSKKNSDELYHFKQAREVINSWPEWKRKIAEMGINNQTEE